MDDEKEYERQKGNEKKNNSKIQKSYQKNESVKCQGEEEEKPVRILAGATTHFMFLWKSNFIFVVVVDVFLHTYPMSEHRSFVTKSIDFRFCYSFHTVQQTHKFQWTKLQKKQMKSRKTNRHQLINKISSKKIKDEHNVCECANVSALAENVPVASVDGGWIVSTE